MPCFLAIRCSRWLDASSAHGEGEEVKRSEINDIIRAGDAFIRSFGFLLPPFAYWSPQQMLDRRAEIGGILGARLGWDITDYGQGRYGELGLFLFTLRNGSEADLRRGGGMCYAEKIMISRQDQISPMHRHIVKAEDIINRGGARLGCGCSRPTTPGRSTASGGRRWRPTACSARSTRARS